MLSKKINNRVNVFISAGNVDSTDTINGRNITSPAKGMNVITVGNYEDNSDKISNGSIHINPITKNEKPEKVAPGTFVTITGDDGTVYSNQYGTSISSPHAAAFAADAMSHNTFLQHSPMTLKAFMLAGNTDDM